jgi:hypothetical protein
MIQATTEIFAYLFSVVFCCMLIVTLRVTWEDVQNGMKDDGEEVVVVVLKEGNVHKESAKQDGALDLAADADADSIAEEDIYMKEENVGHEESGKEEVAPAKSGGALLLAAGSIDEDDYVIVAGGDS